MALPEVKRTDDGRILARRKDGLPLTPEDQEEARRLAKGDDPVLSPDQWYPVFREFVHSVIRETPDFDFSELRRRNLELYRQIKATEIEIDALGLARLSQVMVLMREWRELVLKAEFERREADERPE